MVLTVASRISAQELTVDEILKKTEAAYANSRSYMYSGSVESTYFDENGKQESVTTATFNTAFRRSGQFRFEFALDFGKGVLTHYVLWQNKKDVRPFGQHITR